MHTLYLSPQCVFGHFYVCKCKNHTAEYNHLNPYKNETLFTVTTVQPAIRSNHKFTTSSLQEP